MSVQNTERMVCRVQNNKDEAERSRCGAANPRRRPRLERRVEHMVRDGMGLVLDDMVKGIDTKQTGLSLKIGHERMLAELFREEVFRFLWSA